MKIQQITDDSAVLETIESLRKQGVKIPEFKDFSRDMAIPLVYYNNGFNIIIIFWFAKESDKGWMAIIVENFMTENQLNFKYFEKIKGLDISKLVGIVMLQVIILADQINYPFIPMTVFDKDFIGFTIQKEKPFQETN
jgi:hypothetical protein